MQENNAKLFVKDINCEETSPSRCRGAYKVTIVKTMCTGI